MITREFPPCPGGIGFYVRNLSKKLIERGHDITVITRGSPNKTVKKVVDGITVFYVTFFPVYPFHVNVHGFFVQQLLDSLTSKLTLVHLHSPIVPPVKTTLPVLTTVHTPMKIDSRYHEIVNLNSFAERVQSMTFSPRVESKVFRLSNKITAVSSTVARELKEYGLDPDNVTVVSNGVDEKTFSKIQSKHSTEPYVLYTGGLKARKGIFDLIESTKYVCKKYPNVKFVICGSGPFLKKIKEKAERIGADGYITFLGYVDRSKLIETYQNATIHVVPSHYEGLPTVLLEAMSCGRPVVATNIGGNNEVVSDGVNGLLVPPKNPEKIAQAILRLLDDETLRKSIGNAARETIEKYYTWDKIADNVLDCYETILKK